MHPVVNHLIQLQELSLIKDEQRVSGKGQHLHDLSEAIDSMTAKLPSDTRVLYQKLYKKDHIVIAPISDGVCAACGMKLPISLVQAVRIGHAVHSCPSCARMLFFPESAVRSVGKTTRRTGPRKVGISRFSSHTLMIPRLESGDKEGVIRELAYKMEAEGFVDRGDKLVEMSLEREAIVSTEVDHGLAFPHARGVEGGGLTLALGLSKKGVKFSRSAKSLTRIVFFMAIPLAASAFYLKLLAGLAETFMNTSARKELLAAKDPEKLWKALTKTTRATIK
jgi:mannitol/fructose-specific phosphotransferase system IIA component (Ntr-type)